MNIRIAAIFLIVAGLTAVVFQNCAGPNQISPLDQASSTTPQYPGYIFKTEIASDATNYNLQAVATAGGWDQTKPLNAVVTIDANVAVYSTSPGSAGFSTGTLPAGSHLTLINNGSILGFHSPAANGDKSTNQAWGGGDAMDVEVAATITNAGQIVGGAGTGGMRDCDSCPGCGGGNGGSNGGAGGSAIVANADVEITGSGLIAGAGGGGSSGGGAYAAGICSGPGGDGQGAVSASVAVATAGVTANVAAVGGGGGAYGQAGANGGNAGNGQAYGGSGGYAFVLNGHSVKLNGSDVMANSSYTQSTWLAGTMGRVAP